MVGKNFFKLAINKGYSYLGIHAEKDLFFHPSWGFLFFVGTWRGSIVWAKLKEKRQSGIGISHLKGVLGVNINLIVPCTSFFIQGDLFVMTYLDGEITRNIEVDLSTSSVVTEFPPDFVPLPVNFIPRFWDILTGGEFSKSGDPYFVSISLTKMKSN